MPSPLTCSFAYDNFNARFTSVDESAFDSAVKFASRGDVCPLCRKADEDEDERTPRVVEELNGDSGMEREMEEARESRKTLLYRGQR